MEEIEIEVSKTVKEYHKVTLPIYKKGICHIYKIISQHQCVQVCYGIDSNLSIGIVSIGVAFHGVSEECTEAEFLSIYNEVSEKLKTIAL